MHEKDMNIGKDYEAQAYPQTGYSGYTDGPVTLLCYITIFATYVSAYAVILMRYWGVDVTTLDSFVSAIPVLAWGNAVAVVIGTGLSFFWARRSTYFVTFTVLACMLVAVVPLVFVYCHTGWQNILMSPTHCVEYCNGTQIVTFS